MSIVVYNTQTRTKEEFKPGEPGKVKMYVCGPTTYNYIHLGNARPLVVFDTIRRYLEYKGYQVIYVQNFTDVDDKIIKRAQEEKKDPLELAEKYIGEYYKDAQKLNVRPADYHPKVSEHLDDIIGMISTLLDNGSAYEVDGDVYFRVRSFKDYGKLSGRSLDELKAGARVDIDQRKKDPLDFALWKAARPGEPAWDSPWGPGRPGWHIECSAMSIKYLGLTFDIHGGGYDLVFPHHENELAQAEACTGQPFVRYWLHNGFITVNQEKMSKSRGNFFLVREILGKFPADAVRYYLLSTHYRSPLDFDDQKLAVSQKSLERLKTSQRLVQQTLADFPLDDQERTVLDGVNQEMWEETERVRREFEQAMDDDFNTALALASLFDFARAINSYINRADFSMDKQTAKVLKQGERLFVELGGQVLGILPEENKETIPGENAGYRQLVHDLVELLIEIREGARKRKDWGTADTIRDRLKGLGIALEDTPQGTRWRM